MAREGVVASGIAVDRRAGGVSERLLDARPGVFGDEFVLLGQVHQQRRPDAPSFAKVAFGVAAVIGDGGVEIMTGCGQVGH